MFSPIFHIFLLLYLNIFSHLSFAFLLLVRWEQAGVGTSKVHFLCFCKCNLVFLAKANFYFFQHYPVIWSSDECICDRHLHVPRMQCPFKIHKKREVHLCPLRLGQNGILETIWLLCKYAKITRWPRQNIFKQRSSILPVSEVPFKRKPEDATLEGLAIMKMQLKVNNHFNIKTTLKKTVFGFLKHSALKSFPFSLLIFLSM